MQAGLWVWSEDFPGGPWGGGPSGYLAAIRWAATNMPEGSLFWLKLRDRRGRMTSVCRAEAVHILREEGQIPGGWMWLSPVEPKNPYSIDPYEYVEAQVHLFAGDMAELKLAVPVFNVEADWSTSRFAKESAPARALWPAKAERERVLLELGGVAAGAASAAFPHGWWLSPMCVPQKHAVQYAPFATRAAVVMPQLYFGALGFGGWAKRAIQSLDGWANLGARRLRFSTPGWRGQGKVRAAVGGILSAQEHARKTWCGVAVDDAHDAWELIQMGREDCRALLVR